MRRGKQQFYFVRFYGSCASNGRGVVIWSGEGAESGPQHRLQTANRGVRGVRGFLNDHRLPTTATFEIPSNGEGVLHNTPERTRSAHNTAGE
eukprot:1179610-Prorocentrum_minimum.AAC.1